MKERTAAFRIREQGIGRDNYVVIIANVKKIDIAFRGEILRHNVKMAIMLAGLDLCQRLRLAGSLSRLDLDPFRKRQLRPRM